MMSQEEGRKQFPFYIPWSCHQYLIPPRILSWTTVTAVYPGLTLYTDVLTTHCCLSRAGSHASRLPTTFLREDTLEKNLNQLLDKTENSLHASIFGARGTLYGSTFLGIIWNIFCRGGYGKPGCSYFLVHDRQTIWQKQHWGFIKILRKMEVYTTFTTWNSAFLNNDYFYSSLFSIAWTGCSKNIFSISL